MSESTQIQITQNDPRFSLVEQGKKRDTLARQIKLMIQNGKQLQDHEAMALAQYAVATDLNPFAGECYYIPQVGPTPGIAGWRKKGQEQLEYEAEKAKETGCHFWVEDVDLTEDEKKYVRDGDVACSVVLHDSVSNHRWRMAYLEMAKELTNIGDKNALENAKNFVGKEPVWTGFGIVAFEEKFSYDNKPEKMTRKERALKRAEKIAIRKRFPRIDLPEIMVNAPEPEDMIDGFMVEEPPFDTNDALKKLGFGTTIPKMQDVTPQGYDNPLLNETPAEPEGDPDFPTAPPDQPSLLDTAVAAGGVPVEAPKESLAGKPRSWSPDAVNAALPYTNAKDPKAKTIEAVNMLNFGSLDPKTANAGLVKSWCEYYRQCREGGMTPQESAAAADEEILAK